MSAADLERAVAATDEAVREARELFAEKSTMATHLELAEEQVGALSVCCILILSSSYLAFCSSEVIACGKQIPFNLRRR